MMSEAVQPADTDLPIEVPNPARGIVGIRVQSRPPAPVLTLASRCLPRTVGVDKLCGVLHFVYNHGRLPRLQGKRRFADHLFAIKWQGHYDTALGRRLTDKVTAKEWIEEQVGALSAATLAVLPDKASVAAYDFPATCVIKPSASSGRVVYLRASQAPVPKDLIASWLDEDFYHRTRERHYLGLKNAILVEELIEFPELETLEIKVFCFHGEPGFLQVVRGRFETPTVNYYAPDWRFIALRGRKTNHPLDPPPACLEALLDISRRLSRDFPMMRVDFYSDGQTRYRLGELTLNPNNARQKLRPEVLDWQLARLFEGMSFEEVLADMARLRQDAVGPRPGVTRKAGGEEE